MRFLLGALAVFANFMDNVTTFLCLRRPIAGFEVYEANPAAAWLFDAIGLYEGLLLETLFTTAAVAFVVVTGRLAPRLKLLILAFLFVLPAWAVLNNLDVMATVGVPLLSMAR